MTKRPQLFENLPIKRRDLTEVSKNYRIYKDANNFVIASGKTVNEALTDSGVINAYRVVLHDTMEETVLGDKALGAQRDEVKPADVVAPEQPVEVKPEANPEANPS